MYKRLETKVYKDGKLINTLQNDNELEIARSLIDDFEQIKLFKNKCFEGKMSYKYGNLGKKIIEVEYTSTMGEKYKTIRQYFEE